MNPIEQAIEALELAQSRVDGEVSDVEFCVSRALARLRACEVVEGWTIKSDEFGLDFCSLKCTDTDRPAVLVIEPEKP